MSRLKGDDGSFGLLSGIAREAAAVFDLPEDMGMGKGVIKIIGMAIAPYKVTCSMMVRVC